ncbi:MAG: hypothetical protein ACHQKY_13210 [Terriglobia bacterium]
MPDQEKGRLNPDEYQTLEKIREALDSLVCMSLNLYLKEGNPAKRAEKAKKIIKAVGDLSILYHNETPIMPRVMSAITPARQDCPEGYYNCGGYCLPYPCP